MKKIIQLATRAVLALSLLGAARAADVPLSSLPAISSVTSSTIVPVVDVSGSPTTKKATAGQLVGGLPDATTSTRGIMPAADKLALSNATAAATASALAVRDGSANLAVNVLTAAQVTGLSSPVGTTDAANKAYVDSVASGLTIKNPTVAATTGSNVTLAGGAPNTLDGVTLHANDRVLVKDQTTGTENGIYFVQTLGSGANGTWARTTDADTGAKLVTGSYVFVTGGTANASTSFVMVTPGTITIGTSTITWNLFATIGQIQASSIVGQIVNAQIADAAINTAKFAAGLQPVSIVSSLPSPSGYTGPKNVFNTSDSKLYRYNGTAFVATVPTTDLSGTIGTTQIADNSISTPKLQANSVAAGNIAANAVVAGDIAANAVTAGTIAAGAVNTGELAANAVTAAKIAAGTITATNIAALTITGANIAAGTLTADKLNVSSLSAITANIGTITSGTLTSSISISVGAGTAAVSISSSGATFAGGRITLAGDGTNPFVRVKGVSPYNAAYMELNGGTSGTGPFIAGTDISGAAVFSVTSGAITFSETTNVDSVMQSLGSGSINLFGGSGNAISITCGEDGSAGSGAGYLVLQVNGRSVKVPFNNL